MIDTPKATMSEAKCEVSEEQRCTVCERPIWPRSSGRPPALNATECVGDREQCWRLAFSRSADRIREAKHLISVRMEGFPCADGDACENLKTLQGIAAALDGKEI